MHGHPLCTLQLKIQNLVSASDKDIKFTQNERSISFSALNITKYIPKITMLHSFLHLNSAAQYM
jgi:hypothetical protein